MKLATSKLGISLCLLLCFAIGSLHAATAPAPIRVGMTVSKSGEYQDLSLAFERGVQMWMHDLVERGGNPIDLIVYDDESSPERAASLYEKLIVSDEVHALIGPFSSTLALAAAPVVEKYGAPMVVEATAPTLFEQGYKNVFGIYAPANQNMLGVLGLAREHSLTTIALANQRSAFPEAVVQGVRDAAPGQGFSIVFDESYPEGAVDLSGLAAKLAATRPELIILGAYLQDSIAFVRALKATGFAPKMLAVSGAPAVTEFGDALGKDADGVIATTQWMRSARIPSAFDFGYRYRERYGEYPSYNAAGGYAAGQIIEAAARLADLTRASTPEEFRAGMREQLATMWFQSLLGQYHVNEEGVQVGREIYVIQWQWPHRSLIAPKSIARWEMEFPFPPWDQR